MATKSAKTPKIDNLSLSELEALNKATQQRIADVRETEREKLRAEFEQRASENGFSLAEVVGVKKLPKGPRKPAEPKYRGPDGQEWSGKGRIPGWCKTEDGKRNEDLRIS